MKRTKLKINDLINIENNNNSSLYINKPKGYLLDLLIMFTTYTLSILFLVFGVVMNVFLGSLSPFVVSFILFIIGLISTMHFMKLVRYRKYIQLVEKNEEASIDWISKNLKIDSNLVKKDLNKMINRGIFSQGHLLKDSRYFVINDDLYSKYLVYEENEKKVLEQENVIKSNEKLNAFLDKTNSDLSTLKIQRERINNIDFKTEIDSIVFSINNIMSFIKKHPEDINQLDRFSDYYLPKTIELIEKYIEIETNHNDVDFFEKSKGDIYNTISTMDDAFTKLLSNLAESNSIDVNSDIYVLNTMLSQDGLKETIK